jgi:aminoglycoside 2'-N-acetyltransferase I
MSIEIELVNGAASRPLAEPLFKAAWPLEAIAQQPWSVDGFARADLRVLVEAEDDGVVCHVGLHRREVKWNGRTVRVGGIGNVMTRADKRKHGYASIALNAAVQTFKDEGATDIGLLFCTPAQAAFFLGRGWQPFTGEIYTDLPGRVRFEALSPLVHDFRRHLTLGAIDLGGDPW